MSMLLTKSWYWLLMDPLGRLSAQQETVASKSELEREGLKFLMSLNLSVTEMDSLPIKGMLDILCNQLYSLPFNTFCVLSVNEFTNEAWASTEDALFSQKKTKKNCVCIFSAE